VTKREIYELIIKSRNWTFDEIAKLNLWQQLIAIELTIKDVASDTIEFATEADYQKWLAAK
jgi:hypothetical protein